jgi:ribosomal-protein-alanine N-acetyltransferase
MLEQAASSQSAAQWMRADYERIFYSHEPQRHCFIAAENGEPIGFIVAREIPPEWEIENIVVAARAQRRGVATQLLRAMLELAKSRGAEMAYLEVRDSNAAARAFYEKCGFHISGRRAAYYSDPQEDALLYRHNF